MAYANPKQHFHIATDGVRSCNPCVIATMGLKPFGIKVEVSAEKYSPYFPPKTIDWQDYNQIVGDNYLIRITVTHKNRKWVLERLISEPLFDRLQVFAQFIKMEKLRTRVSAAYRGMINTIKVIARMKD